MAASELSYVTLDVFTSTRLKGNQVAVVEVPDAPLAPELMQMIAREFNFSETVFLQTNVSRGKRAYLINIFTPVAEMNFAGHPIIGTGHVLFKKLLPDLLNYGEIDEDLTIITNSGPVEISYNSEQDIVSAEVPHNVHVHSRGTTKQSILDTQPNLSTHTDVSNIQDRYPAVSIVKGVTYTLVDFTGSPELFSAVHAGKSQDTELDDGWAPSFTGVMYYKRLGQPTPGKKPQALHQKLRVRMVAINLEDPACGSGSTALCAYLALQDGKPHGEYEFTLDQGKEIGRDSLLRVTVTLDGSGTGISKVFLAGNAVLVTQGTMHLP